MGGINFKEVNSLIALVQALDEALSGMQADAVSREEEVRLASESWMEEASARSLEEIPVEELKKSKAGIRINALQEAGYRNLKDLSDADESSLLAVDGIGGKQTAAIRSILAQFRQQFALRKTIRLSPDDVSESSLRLIRALAIFRISRQVLLDVSSVQTQFHDLSREIINRIRVRSFFKWLFAGREIRNETVSAIEDLTRFTASPLFERAAALQGRYAGLSSLSIEEAKRDFERSSAQYYVLLEKVTGKGFRSSAFDSSLPEDLAASIDAFPLKRGLFTGGLRSYQEFGVKYILHQRRVLLGDDMGLGKTVQAIAAISHLHEEDGRGHSLIICPAGVLINWCREIRRFSSMNAWLLHGKKLEEEFSRWTDLGGIAVTSFEIMNRIVERIDNRMRILMLVIDEAHYIKNPNALRTRSVRMLQEEAAHILLMTGTPLENRVDEMCSLIDFVRPDLSGQVRRAVSYSRTQEFREMISPVYLRRRRDEVLRELPPVEVREEWCGMSEDDRRAYAEQVGAGSFMGARRVGFLQEDLSTSSKAQRLKELCMEAEDAGRKAIVYSFFLETIRKAESLLKERCAGVITGSTDASRRQEIVDRFESSPGGSVLVCQVQAGGTGLNIQAASIVIFCEPQIKPSLIHQSVARAWRMGQVRNVLVCHLLCEDTVDEAVMERIRRKQLQFDLYAEESAAAKAAEGLVDKEWIRDFMEKEHMRYLPAVIVPDPEMLQET